MERKRWWTPPGRERKEAEERAARMVQALCPWMFYRWRHVVDVTDGQEVRRVVISAPGIH